MHLSLLEHGIYRQLLDEYYLNEKPIKTQSVIRRLCIKTDDELNALNSVLSDFFAHDAQADEWHHTRANQEIEAYCTRVETARANGNKGGRPKMHKETKSVNFGNPKETEVKTNHKPLTINQEPISNKCISEYFEQFWCAGMCKKNKKRSESLFSSIFKKQKNPEQFTQRIVADIKTRLERNQLGFSEMHPTTYLNGERWEDDLPKLQDNKNNIFDLGKQKFVTEEL